MFTAQMPKIVGINQAEFLDPIIQRHAWELQKVCALLSNGPLGIRFYGVSQFPDNTARHTVFFFEPCQILLKACRYVRLVHNRNLLDTR